MTKKPNRLINEKSPYLLQHAYNPVDWYPWSDEAFEKAKNENKPIFLSIGYSTCHWCHVMERESFEDPEVAELMNDAFVSIKVDREERPDLDHIYMSVCQAITGSGGWPLTVVMTPDKKPFFAGTYFPKIPGFNQIGMLLLIPEVKKIWDERQQDLIKSAENITEAVRKNITSTRGDELDDKVLTKAYEQLEKRFDPTNGGFTISPKFPTPHNLLFLLRYWNRTGDKKAIDMVERTLQSMRAGGIFDHIGYGFHRYSTDEEWLVPHFEKMLYDQAQLIIAYTETYQVTQKEIYRRIAEEILEYTNKVLLSPEGGYFSAEDADSEGKEGKFYVWNEAELRHHLDKEEAEFVINVFNIEKHGNFIEPLAGKEMGTNILHLQSSIAEMASENKISEDTFFKKLDGIREKLDNIRDKRVHPFKDDKILTDWNGLMIAALAKAAQAFDKPEYTEIAEKVVEFILNNLRDPKGKLLHRYREGEASIPANLDDHAFLIWGLIELYETTFNTKYLELAVEFNDELLNNFWDQDQGAFYFTSRDSEELIIRKKEIYDGAVPSGNSIAFLNLIRLSRSTGDPKLEAKAIEIGRAFSEEVSKFPSAYTQLMVGLDFVTGPSYEVVVEGDPDDAKTVEVIKALRTNYLPNKIVHLNPELEKSRANFDFLKDDEVSKKVKDTKVYVCSNYSCQQPTTSIDKVLELLNVRKV